MAIKKATSNETYEYFKVSEVYFYGKFKDYVDALWTQNKIQESYVRRLVDLYAIAAVIGLKLRYRLENDSSGEKRTVQLAQLTENYQTLLPIMRLVLMLDESRGLDEEERVRSAFKMPETKEEHDDAMELFNSYARGGIEYLYQRLVVSPAGVDSHDYGDDRVNKLVAFINDPTGSQTLL